jgi:cytochrome c-type biogenesis protein CcmE
MDLTPRTATETGAQPPARKRRWLPIVIVVAALLGGGVIVTQFLTSAIDYYCNVDEIGVRSGCDGERRMRVQGVVEQSSVKQADGGTTFVLDFNEKTLKVAYSGDPGGVFQECIPVIAHGRMVNGVFESDRIEVKHSNQYVEKNEARIDQANEEAAACSVLKG